MAKWKNIALISTIVAPIAFGVGDAFAQANRPTNDSCSYARFTDRFFSAL
ncbi:hypothetical protein [Weissella confusa]|nr:hypothetical protein [Weissella confusa]MBJ7693254.1 hypothetical protein [Weissella confusa]